MINLFIELCSHIIAVSVGLLAFKKMPAAFRLILLVISLALLNELTTAYLNSNKINGNWTNNLYLVLDCSIFLTAGYLLLCRNKPLYIFITVYALFAVECLNHVINNGVNSFALQAYIIDSIILIILYGMILYQDALNRKEALWLSPQLWLSLAIIFFYGCNIPYFSMIQTVAKLSKEQKEFLHLFLVVINNLHYLLMAVMFIIIYLRKAPLENETNRR